MLRGAAVWVGLGLMSVAMRAWAAPAPGAVQPLVQPLVQSPSPPKSNPPSMALPEPGPAPRRQSPPPRTETFGRWQPRLQSCEHTLPGGGAGDCGAVLVDQRGAGVMRVSWPARGASAQASVLTFVGVLSGPSEPMACRQAICRLSRPIELTLSTVSLSQFDARGVASALPSAWPVNGGCRLEVSRIRCEARALSGERWLASAGLN